MSTPPTLRSEADRIRSVDRTYAEYDDQGKQQGRNARRRQYENDRGEKYPSQPKGKVREEARPDYAAYKHSSDRADSAHARYDDTLTQEQERMRKRSDRSRERYTGPDEIDQLDSLAHLRLSRRAHEAHQRDIPNATDRNLYLLGREEKRGPGLDSETLNYPDNRVRDKHVEHVVDNIIPRASRNHDNSLKHMARIRHESPSLRDSSPDSRSYYKDKTGRDLLEPPIPAGGEGQRRRSRSRSKDP